MSGFTDKLKGKLDESIGMAKEKMAAVSEHKKDEGLKSEGQAQNLKGQGEGVLGNVKEKAEDTSNDVSDAVKDKFKKTG